MKNQNICDICGQDCFTKGGLKIHKQVHHPMNDLQKPVKEIQITGYGELVQERAIAPVQDEATMLISQAIDKKVPVEALERLLTMRRELKQERAKEEYDRAMAAFQANCPTIEKKKQGYNYKYAPLESIVEQVKELLSKNGFSYTFDTDEVENAMVVYCKVKHTAGHMEVSKAQIARETTTKMNASQQSGAAMTYGKRYAFCNAFGILTGDEDTDVNSPTGKKNNNHSPSYTPQKSLYQAARENPVGYQKALKEKEEEIPLINASQQIRIRQLGIQKGITLDDIEEKIAATVWKNGKAKTKLSELNEQEANSLIKTIEEKLPDKKKNSEVIGGIDLDLVDQAIDPEGKFNKK